MDLPNRLSCYLLRAAEIATALDKPQKGPTGSLLGERKEEEVCAQCALSSALVLFPSFRAGKI